VSKVTPFPTRAVTRPGAPARYSARIRPGAPDSLSPRRESRGLEGGSSGRRGRGRVPFEPPRRRLRGPPPRGAREVVGAQLGRRRRDEGTPPVDRLADPCAQETPARTEGNAFASARRKETGRRGAPSLLVPVVLEGRQGGAECAEARAVRDRPARAAPWTTDATVASLHPFAASDGQNGLARVIRGEFPPSSRDRPREPRGGQALGGRGKGFPELPREVAVADRRRDRAPDRRIDVGGRPAGRFAPRTGSPQPCRLSPYGYRRKRFRCAWNCPLSPFSEPVHHTEAFAGLSRQRAAGRTAIRSPGTPLSRAGRP